jgi:hypothetical protein
MTSAGLTIRGIQKAQAANLKIISAMKPGGALSRAVKNVTIAAHRYSVANTHVDTGSLRASHRIELEAGMMRGHVYIAPDTVNPRTGNRPSVYGLTEHNRGGHHAFYERTVTERGAEIVATAAKALRAELP